MTKKLCVICDIDGTIAEKGERGYFDWNLVGTDRPIAVIINLLHILAPHYEIILVSGRSDESLKPTREWLAEHNIPHSAIYMRKKNDFRKDSIVKQELYAAHIEPDYEVQFVLEDRNQAVDMWREIGLTCLQVAPGDF